MRARARGLGEGVEIELSLVVDSLFPVATVAAALGDMRGFYPSVGIHMWVSPLGGPLSALREGRATIGIVVGEEFRDRRIETRPNSSPRCSRVSWRPIALSRRRDGVGRRRLCREY